MHIYITCRRDATQTRLDANATRRKRYSTQTRLGATLLVAYIPLIATRRKRDSTHLDACIYIFNLSTQTRRKRDANATQTRRKRDSTHLDAPRLTFPRRAAHHSLLLWLETLGFDHRSIRTSTAPPLGMHSCTMKTRTQSRQHRVSIAQHSAHIHTVDFYARAPDLGAQRCRNDNICV
jgi:hypothetical protein